ncbi:MAG: hypothetical protein ACRD1V_12265 [Vicinamibacterales bacterium]
MRRASTAVAAASAAIVLAALPLSADSGVERAFAPGGRVQFHLAAADYRIVGAPDGRIRVTWTADAREDTAQVGADIQVTGASALVTTRGPKNGLHFTIDVPQRTDVDVTLSAGDLDLTGVQGSKSVSSWAGDVTIDVGRAADYGRVDAAVRFGDLVAHPFNYVGSGIWHSLTRTGSGKQTLKVRLFAGDLILQ